MQKKSLKTAVKQLRKNTNAKLAIHYDDGLGLTSGQMLLDENDQLKDCDGDNPCLSFEMLTCDNWIVAKYDEDSELDDEDKYPYDRNTPAVGMDYGVPVERFIDLQVMRQSIKDELKKTILKETDDISLFKEMIDGDKIIGRYYIGANIICADVDNDRAHDLGFCIVTPFISCKHFVIWTHLAEQQDPGFYMNRDRKEQFILDIEKEVILELVA